MTPEQNVYNITFMKTGASFKVRFMAIINHRLALFYSER